MAGIEWVSADDMGFMKQRLTWIDGLRPSTNTSGHGVIIFSKREEEYHGSARKLTRHTLQICMDEFGERVHAQNFPLGAHIRQVKAEAEKLLARFRAEGHKIISD